MMKNQESALRVEVSLRDVQLFSEVLSDRRQVSGQFERQSSNVWVSEGSQDQVEDLVNEVQELLRESGSDWLEVEFFVNDENYQD